MAPIEFNKPALVGNEIRYVLESLQDQIAGDGPFTRRCEAFLESALGVPRVFLTPSCTHALEMAALLLDIRDGDEVILPSFTFVSTANAFVIRGARPVFADIRPDTLNIDPAHVAALVGARTRAIVPVHYGGLGCDMEEILAIAGRAGLAVVEDNAHGLFGRRRGRQLGTFGALSALSFHETKNFTCGEGGALVVNDQRLLPRAELVRAKGTDRSSFLRGEVDRYTWVDAGSSFLPSEIQAAFLLAQLEKRTEIMDRRERIFRRYAEHLGPWAAAHEVRLPVVPPGTEPAYHIFWLMMPTPDSRDGLIAHLLERGIRSAFHYVPLHSSPMGRTFGDRTPELPVTDDVSARLLRLPFHFALADEDVARVVEAVLGFPLPG